MKVLLLVLVLVALLTVPKTMASSGYPTDVNQDGKVDLRDVYTVCRAYGSDANSSNWNPRCDVTGDMKVDLRDVYAVMRDYGTTVLAPVQQKLYGYFDECVAWINNSGVLLPENRVSEGVNWNGKAWIVSTGTRIDAQCEAAMAFTYAWKKTRNTAYRDKAVQLLLQAKRDSDESNGGQAWMCTGRGSSSCYTQDNGRMMRCYTLAFEESNDMQIKNILISLADFWSSTVPADGGVGIGKNMWGLDYLPDKYPKARHIGELLTGMVEAYKVVNKEQYLDAAERLGNWLVANQTPFGNWSCSDAIDNAGGHIIESTSLALRGLSELYQFTRADCYKIAADKAFNWLLGECLCADNIWGRGQLPSECSFDPRYNIFNSLYMQTPSALIMYSNFCGNSSAYELANHILYFMGNTTMMHGESRIEGGMVGEWDLSTNQRSTRYDNEMMCWGNWIYTGWTNCEYVETCGLLFC